VKTIISELELAIYNMGLIRPNGGFQEDVVNEVKRNITWAITKLKAPPRWETPEQRKERTGEDWPDDWAIYAAVMAGGKSVWAVMLYRAAKDFNIPNYRIVCATEAGKPPENWKPEGVQ
jgi:hypothetical protein